jgi:glycine betaine/proline transport system permease protein
MIHIGPYIEAAIEWLTDHFAPFFDVLNIGIEDLLAVFRRYCLPYLFT